MPKFVWVSIFLVILIFIPVRLLSAFSINILGIHTLHIISTGVFHELNIFHRDPSSVPCSAYWFQGFLAQVRSNQLVRDAAWQVSMQCNSRYIRFLRLILPYDTNLAYSATQAQPDTADSWFWLAEATGMFANHIFTNLIDANRPEIVLWLQMGLSLDPTDGMRWRLLGDVLRPIDPQAAISAYLNSCLNGDPGSNGCWLAGFTAEQIGEIENAIRYYRYSNWDGALNRAAELEFMLDASQEW